MFKLSVYEDAAHGRTVLSRFGQEIPFRCTQRQLRTYEEAKVSGVLQVKGYRYGKENLPLSNLYEAWTRCMSRPFVIGEHRRGYLELHIDMFYGRRLTALGQHELWLMQRDAYPRHLRTGVCMIGHEILYLRVPRAQAPAFLLRVQQVLATHVMAWDPVQYDQDRDDVGVWCYPLRALRDRLEKGQKPSLDWVVRWTQRASGTDLDPFQCAWAETHGHESKGRVLYPFGKRGTPAQARKLQHALMCDRPAAWQKVIRDLHGVPTLQQVMEAWDVS
jgi:hypothetical protein